MPGAKTPSFLFKDWNPEEEFEVVKARANNPKGYNGK